MQNASTDRRTQPLKDMRRRTFKLMAYFAHGPFLSLSIALIFLDNHCLQVFLRISKGSSSQASNSRMAARFLTTTSKRSPRFISFCVSEVACRSLSKLWQERPSPWKSSHRTALRMSKQRSKTKKVTMIRVNANILSFQVGMINVVDMWTVAVTLVPVT